MIGGEFDEIGAIASTITEMEEHGLLDDDSFSMSIRELATTKIVGLLYNMDRTFVVGTINGYEENIRKHEEERKKRAEGKE